MTSLFDNFFKLSTISRKLAQKIFMINYIRIIFLTAYAS